MFFPLISKFYSADILQLIDEFILKSENSESGKFHLRSTLLFCNSYYQTR